MKPRVAASGLKSLLLALALVSCAPVGTSNPAAPPPSGVLETPRRWVTSADPDDRLSPRPGNHWQPIAEGGAPVVLIEPEVRFQTMAGFGAAITDSSALLIQSLPQSSRARLLAELFSRENDGLGFSVTRLPIGASDFSQTHYSLADGPIGTPLNLAPAEAHMLPTVLAAQALNPDLFIIASPWSAPASMKSTNSLIQGTLNAAAYPAFANYLRDYVVAMGRRGVTIDALTIQNEPHFEPTNYPGMRLTPPQRAEFVGRHLGPLFESSRLSTAILEWDHNWNEPESPAAVLRDPVAARYIRGVAWHCYAGDVAAQSTVQREFPDKEVWFTECSGGRWAPDFADSLQWMTRNLVIGATRHWARGVVMWNIALDENSGPHLGGCGDCRGVVTIDSGTAAITRNV